eukprot:TRINITY_DN1733_c0_g2_i4.p1 TRINITY_DN1733_c0_g2~~TRINITY_DN1733_c0_g2_i4.p1  ORF type:complete len:1437 (+),score=453.19 TRINITY_DN1733_c0_g2_i4:428-4738(+)
MYAILVSFFFYNFFAADCPSDCNGRGKCEPIGSWYQNGRQFQYDSSFLLWEEHKMFGCQCDAGFTGSSCEYRMCPRADDPFTANQYSKSIHITTSVASGSLGGNFIFSFMGETVPFSAVQDAVSESECKELIESLKSIDTATCTIKSNANGGNDIWIIFDKFSEDYFVLNNVHVHDGNPSISKFLCNVQSLTGDTAACSVEDTDLGATSQGTYTGSVDATYIIEISSQGDGNGQMFKWRASNDWWMNEQQMSDSSFITLSRGVEVKFNSVYGHTIGAQWNIPVTVAKAQVTSVEIDTVTTGSDIDLKYFTLYSQAGTKIAVYFDKSNSVAFTGDHDVVLTVTAFVDGDDSTALATAAQTIIDANGELSATVSTSLISITDANVGVVANAPSEDTADLYLEINIAQAGTVASTATSISLASSSKEYLPCAGRGSCNLSKGLCTCDTDFHGTACGDMRTFYVVDGNDDGNSMEIGSRSVGYIGTMLKLDAAADVDANAYTFLDCTARGISVFSVSDSGVLTCADDVDIKRYTYISSSLAGGQLIVKRFGMIVNAGGMIVEHGLSEFKEGGKIIGGLEVYDDDNAADLPRVDVDVMNIRNSNTGFSHDLLIIDSARGASNSYRSIEAFTNCAISELQMFALYGDGTLLFLPAAQSDSFNLKVSDAGFISTIFDVSTNKATNSDFDFLRAITNNNERFTISGEGVMNLYCTSTDLNCYTLSGTDISYTGSFFKAKIDADIATLYKMFDFNANGSDLVTGDNDGKVTVHQGGLEVSADGATIEGGMEIYDGLTAEVGLRLESEALVTADSLTMEGNNVIATTDTGEAGYVASIISTDSVFTGTTLVVSESQLSSNYKLLDLATSDCPIHLGGTYTNGAPSTDTLTIEITSAGKFKYNTNADAQSAELDSSEYWTDVTWGLKASFDSWASVGSYTFDMDTLSCNTFSSRFSVGGSGTLTTSVLGDLATDGEHHFRRATVHASNVYDDVGSGDTICEFENNAYSSGAFATVASITVADTGGASAGVMSFKTKENGSALTDALVTSATLTEFKGDANFGTSGDAVKHALTIGKSGVDTELTVNSFITTNLVWEGTTDDEFETTLTFPATADMTLTFPDDLRDHCPKEWDEYGGMCYKVSDTATTWAAKDCDSFYTGATFYTSWSTIEYLKSIETYLASQTEDVFVGMESDGTGTWTFIGGGATPYGHDYNFNWGGGSPTGTNKCLMWDGANKYFVDVDCAGAGTAMSLCAFDDLLTANPASVVDTAEIITTGNLEKITRFGTVDTEFSITVTDNWIHSDSTVEGLEIIETSDERLKKDITPIPTEDSLNLIRSLEGVSYFWNNETRPNSPTDKQLGFIAQAVEEVLPELVKTESKGNKAVAYTKMFPLLVNSLQEIDSQYEYKKNSIKERIQKQKDVLEDQNQRITALTEQISKLMASSRSIRN